METMSVQKCRPAENAGDNYVAAKRPRNQQQPMQQSKFHVLSASDSSVEVQRDARRQTKNPPPPSLVTTTSSSSLGISTPVITLTFGDCAENHVGMQKLGQAAAEGLTCAELVDARARFEAAGCVCELIDLNNAVAECVLEPLPAQASVLIVRQGVTAMLQEDESHIIITTSPLEPTAAPTEAIPAEQDTTAAGSTLLLREQSALVWDTKARMKGRVVNKRARHNLCFGPTAQEPDYKAGRGRVVAFGDVPLLARIRERLPQFLGPKTHNLYAEGNLYPDPATACGIGFHGDAERRIVVALRLGGTMPLHYQWFQRGAPVGKRIALELHHGDMYVMSAKAVGTDWMKKLVPTLRHAAGAPKYLTIPTPLENS